MNDFYDYVVIGAGPSALAVLMEFGDVGENRIAVITGEDKGQFTTLHAKVASTSYEAGEQPGLAEEVKFKSGSAVHSSAKVGGLASYWGQQFQRYRENEPWQVTGCESYETYLELCEEIESNFHLTGGQQVKRIERGNVSLNIEEPRLMLGTKKYPNSGCGAMRIASELLWSKLAVSRINSRVVICRPSRFGVELDLTNGTSIQARRVFLAAGVVGTMQILLRSFTDIDRAEFSDHAPYMLYPFGKLDWLGECNSRESGASNTHGLSLTCSDDPCLFASVYQVARAPMSLLLSMLGIKPALRGHKVGSLGNFIRPVQVWTSDTVSRYRVSRDAAEAEVVHAPNTSRDHPLRALRSLLTSLGVLSVVSKTPAGYGFHYHDLHFLLRGQGGISSDDLVRERFDEKMFIVDGSSLSSLGCRPHTLSLMVYAARKCQALTKSNLV